MQTHSETYFQQIRFYWIGILLIVSMSVLSISLGGCKGPTINPTGPVVDPTSAPDEPTPTPTGTPQTPEQGTPTPGSTSYDGYADTPDDPTIETLNTDEESYTVSMDYTGDIDWYKIKVPQKTEILSIELFDIPDQSDFDLIVYDVDLVEFENGRSTQAGNSSELVEIEDPGELVYLQVYSYSGRGTAVLLLTTTQEEQQPEALHLSYEDILSTYYPRYPRGGFSGLLERSIEVVTSETISCQGGTESVEGILTVGSYAHVERSVLTLTDYIDGWALAVFNGSIQDLTEMMVTIRVSIDALELGLTVDIPPDMVIRDDEYVETHSQENVYYIAEAYGDLWDSSANDIQVSSAVVGDLGTLLENVIFTQHVDVNWRLVLSDGTRCSGDAEAIPIEDFETVKLFSLPLEHFERVW